LVEFRHNRAAFAWVNLFRTVKIEAETLGGGKLEKLHRARRSALPSLRLCIFALSSTHHPACGHVGPLAPRSFGLAAFAVANPFRNFPSCSNPKRLKSFAPLEHQRESALISGSILRVTPSLTSFLLGNFEQSRNRCSKTTRDSRARLK